MDLQCVLMSLPRVIQSVFGHLDALQGKVLLDLLQISLALLVEERLGVLQRRQKDLRMVTDARRRLEDALS